MVLGPASGVCSRLQQPLGRNKGPGKGIQKPDRRIRSQIKSDFGKTEAGFYLHRETFRKIFCEAFHTRRKSGSEQMTFNLLCSGALKTDTRAENERKNRAFSEKRRQRTD